jgi:hypothetical protein
MELYFQQHQIFSFIEKIYEWILRGRFRYNRKYHSDSQEFYRNPRNQDIMASSTSMVKLSPIGKIAVQ